MLVSQDMQAQKRYARPVNVKQGVLSCYIWGHGAGAVFIALILCLGLAPFGVAALGIVYVIFCCVFYISFRQLSSFRISFQELQNRNIFVFLVLSCLYLFANSLWATDLSMALTKSFYVACVSLSFCLFIILAPKLPNYIIARHALLTLIGGGIAVIYLVVEIFSHQMMTKYVLNLFPWLVGHEFKPAIGSIGNLRYIASYFLNKNVAAVNLLLWPLLLLILNWYAGYIRLFLLTLCYLSVGFVTFYSESDTAKIGFLLSTLTFLLSVYFSHFVRLSLIVLWSIAVIFTLPLMSLPYDLGLQNAHWLSYSARDRIHLWDYTAQEAQKNIILGIGLRSTRFEAQKAGQHPDQLECTQPLSYNEKPICRRPGWHPHNMFLEVWYELGGIGALLLLCLGIVSINRIARYAAPVRQIGYATFVMICVVLSFGWGMWQSWLIGSILASIITFGLARQFHDRRDKKLCLNL